MKTVSLGLWRVELVVSIAKGRKSGTVGQGEGDSKGKLVQAEERSPDAE